MNTTHVKKAEPKGQRGWLAKTALVAFAAVALADLTGCAALKNSADTLGNAAGTQVTKGGLWLMGKDADCQFNAVNSSSYHPGAGANSGTVTANGCRELPSMAAQIKVAEQQEAVLNVHIREQMKRQQETQEVQNRMMQKQHAALIAQQAIDTCQRREIELLGQGKKMAPDEGCVTILNQEKQRNAELASAAAARAKESSGFFSGWKLRD